MQEVLFGDIFINIESHLAPKHLHKLLQSCKRFNQMITENIIKNNIIQKIKGRLCTIFEDNYDEFIEILKMADASIIGKFITQCILDEVWTEDSIDICTICPLILGGYSTFSSTESDDGEIISENKLVRFMKDKQYKMVNKNDMILCGNNCGNLSISVLCYCIKNIKISFFSLYHKNRYISMEEYVHNYTEYNVNKNIYGVKSEMLYTYRMNEIFAKCTNISRFNYLTGEFLTMYGQKFKFYRSEADKKIMSNDDIIQTYYHIVELQTKNKHTYLDGRTPYMIKNNAIYCKSHRKRNNPVFDIIGKLVHRNPNPLYIYECAHNKCNVRSLCQNLEHYHCIFGDEQEFDEKIDDHRAIIFILK